MRRIQLFLARSLLVFFAFGLASGDIPHILNFQGYLVDEEGPITGSLEATFRIYNEPTGGEMLWQETDSIFVENGLYSLNLGEINPLDISLDSDLWIGIQITGRPEMYPRYRQASVPFTFTAEYSDSSATITDGSVTSGKLANNAVTSDKIQNGTIQFADIGQNGASYGQVMKWYGSSWLAANDNDNADTDWTVSGNNMWSGVSGNVGIGTNSLPSKLTVLGSIRNVNSSGSTQILLTNTADQAGNLSIYGPNSYLNLSLTRFSSYSNNGYFGVHGSDGQAKVSAYVGATGQGLIETRGSNGNPNIKLDNVTGESDYGKISLHGQGGAARVNTYVSTSGYGVIEAFGANGNRNAVIDATGYPNRGRLSIMNDSGDPVAGIYINSSGQSIVWADNKNFRMTDPYDPDMDIWYCSLEGPEAAAYIRGTARLNGGSAEISMPDHFIAVASSQGITVQITPLSAGSKGLAVTEKSPERIVVRELFNGNGSYDFDYTVTAVRKGYENYQVIRPLMETPGAETSTD